MPNGPCPDIPVAARWPEHRRKPRLYALFPVSVRGADAEGRAFGASGMLENISSGGFYLRTCRPLRVGDEISVTVRLNLLNALSQEGPLVALRARALRVESHGNGLFGVASEIRRHRFLYPQGCGMGR